MMKLNLLSRPAHTLLFVGREKTLRVDTGKQGELLGDVEAIDVICESLNELPAALEKILASGLKLGRRTWLLSHHITTQELSLPTVQTAGVSPAILTEALRFEFEALTGQSAAQCHLAHRLLGAEDDMSRFWIALMPEEIFKRIRILLARQFSRLGGLVHPGCLPEALSGGEVRDWLRVEFWQEAIFGVHWSPGSGLAVQTFRNHRTEGGWSPEMERWRRDVGPVERSEALLTGQLEFVADVDQSFHLGSHEALFNWLAAWARQLIAAENPLAPAIKVPERGDKELILTVGIAAAALLVCILHFAWFSHSAAGFAADTEALKETEQAMKSARDGLNKLRDKKENLEKQMEKLAGDSSLIPGMIALLQRRPIELLRSLAQRRAERLVVEKIGVSGDHVVVEGVTLDPTLPNEYAAALDQDLNDLGWQITPPKQKNLALFPSGGPWAFTLPLRDTGIEGFKERQQSTSASANGNPQGRKG